MTRSARSAPTGAARAPYGDRGFTVIEVMVSLALLAVLASAVLATVTDSVGLARANESRVSASNLAHRVLETARIADPTVAPVASETVTVGGVAYTVTRSVESVQQAGSSARCGVTPDRVVAQRLHVGVDWPKRGGQPPVRVSTLRTVDMNAVAPNSGTLYVVAENAEGASVSGVTVSLAPVGLTATTDTSGCAVFAGLVPRADYVATLKRTGYADTTGVAEPSRGPIAVTRGSVVEELFVYSPFSPESPPGALSVSPGCVANATPLPRAGGSAVPNQSNGAVTGTNPTGTQVGDLLVAHLVVSGGPPAASIQTPGGWTLLNVTVNAGNVTQALYHRIATASSTGVSNTWNYGSGKAIVGVSAWGGVHARDGVAVWNVGTSSTFSTSAVAPGVTTPWNNVRLVAFYGSMGGVTFTPPPGMTERYDVSTGGAAGSVGHVSASLAGEDFPTAGATGARTATESGSTLSVGHLVAIAPTRTPNPALSWSATTWPSADGYYLRRSVGATLQRDWTVTGRTTTSTTDGPLVNGTSYLYELAAVAGTSVSDPVTATHTPDC